GVSENIPAPNSPLTIGRAYPSPTRGTCSISFSTTRTCSDGMLRVRNSLGVCVLERSMGERIEPGEHSVTVDMTGRPSGTYWVSIEADGIRTTTNIQVIR
ncbi:MAG: T9SS type A sorting domain-containing protein, partial [Bacteroidota bacterium]